MDILLACMHTMFLVHREVGIRSSGTGVIDGCEPEWRYWEANLCPLQNNKCSKLQSHLSIAPNPSNFRFNSQYLIVSAWP